MKEDILRYLECRKCNSEFQIISFYNEKAEVIDGILQCKNCKEKIIIFEGIPRFVPISFIEFNENFKQYLDKYRYKIFLSEKTYNEYIKKNENKKKLKKNTSKYFGYEWDYFKDWGWISEENLTENQKKYEFYGGLITNTERAFKSKCMLEENDLDKGKLVLDAGCGNGRYTYQAAKYGAKIIGVDIGYGVKSAYEHLKNNKNVHIIQGDLFNLPFRKNIFDSVFSNGVLMHTGNAKRAFFSICQHVKKNGVFVAHLYHKGNIFFEIIDRTIRFFTVRMSIEKNLKFASFMANWGKKLKEKGKIDKYYKFIIVLPTLHHMFDWYSAQIATHHTYKEVKRWYEKANFKILKTNEPLKEFYTFINKPQSLTIKGKKI